MRAIASHISSAPLDDTARGALLAQLQGPDRASALGRRLVAPLQNPAPEFDALFVWLDDATTGS